MRTEIVEVSNPHFEWAKDENGNAVKKILSEKVITKRIKITYDDDEKEVDREAYIEPEKPELTVDFSKISDEQLLELKKRLNKI